MDDATKKLLEELARKLGTTAQELGIHTVAHTEVAAWVSVVIGALILSCSFVLAFVSYRFYCLLDDRDCSFDSSPPAVLFGCLSCICAFFGIVLIGADLPNALEPVGATVKQLLGK